MRDLDEYEAIRNLNPCTDKLGRDRDFKDSTMTYLNNLDKRVEILESLFKKYLENQKKVS